MISSSTWVPRGFALEFPEQYELDDAEMERINQLALLELSDAREDLAEAEADESDDKSALAALSSTLEIDDDLKAYDLENYDNDTSEGQEVTMFPGLSSEVQYHEGDEGNDPYLLLPNQTDEAEEKAENQIYPTDNLVLATRTEDEISFLDVYVYDDGAGAPVGAQEEDGDFDNDGMAPGMVREPTLYVHHDIMLPAFPLCVEWVNYRPGKLVVDESNPNIGNFAAIGTMDPQIEIWNLDCVDKAFPDVILGQPQPGQKKKKKKGKGHVTTHHTDAVLSLAHNRVHRLVLASTSADHTVKLWDLNTADCVRSFCDIHGGATVSLSQWHPSEAQILLTGGYDGKVAVLDVRMADELQLTKQYKIGNGQEIESVRWGSLPELFYAGTDGGNVYCFDVRDQKKPLWTLHAHDASISSMDVNPHIPGMLITLAMGEKVVKLWKCSQGTPSMVILRDFGIGNVLTLSFAPDIEVAGCAVVGGVTGDLKLWDVLTNSGVRRTFRDEVSQMQQRAREEAQTVGKPSRMARKYQGEVLEVLMLVEAGGDDDELDADEGDVGGDDIEEDQ